jgi:hypothetical protein
LNFPDLSLSSLCFWIFVTHQKIFPWEYGNIEI